MFQYYLIHYFNFKNAGGFMLVSLLCLIAVLAIVILAAKLKKHYKLNTQDLTPKQIPELNIPQSKKKSLLIESFYEVLFPVLRYCCSCLFIILSMSGSHRLPFTGRNTRTLSYFYFWYFLYL